jgi:quercetin dioxygenase-like cupin family protein
MTMSKPERVELKQRRGFVGTALVALAALLTRAQEAAASRARTSPRQKQIGRRVITGVDAQGRSRIDTEAPPPANATWNEDGVQGMDFWVVRQVPAPLDSAIEPTGDWELSNRAPPGGLIGRLITWPPGFEYPAHATRTLDLGVIVSGRLELILDTGSTILEPGDVLVQRGTAHGWRVVGSEPCTWVVVMIDAPSRS